MGVFSSVESMGHEQVAFCHDGETGLKAIIAVHDTTLGPALGGCRFWNYGSEEEAIFDVLRLSKGMTYKAAVAGLPLGGGKSVILGDPKKLKSEKFFRTFGRFVDSLNGRYITAEDVNIKVEDMNAVAKETNYVSGITTREGGSGDPSPVTALGVFSALKASVKFKLEKDSLAGLTVAVQGTGAVGRHLCQYLHEEGASLVVADINKDSIDFVCKEYGARSVGVDEIFAVDCDVFAPCALGAIINDSTIPQLKAPIVCGGANNQLLDEHKHGLALQEKGILYAPDYVANAGGLINVCYELKGYNADEAKGKARHIYDTMLEIYKEAEKEAIPTFKASDNIAEKRINEARAKGGKLRNTFDNQDWITVGK